MPTARVHFFLLSLLALGVSARAAPADAPAAAAAATGVARIRHAPEVSATIEGSVQMMLAEDFRLQGNATLSRDLRVPGSPTVRLSGQPDLGAFVDCSGAAEPANYQITLGGTSSLGRVVRRTDPIPLPAVIAPLAPAGTRSVSLNGSAGTVGDFATVRHLTLNGNGGRVAIPAGSYGDFTASGDGVFVLGVPGALQPAMYHLQRLSLNGNAQLQVAGPVMLTVAHGVILNGSADASGQPGWLRLDIFAGGLTLSGSARFHGYVTAPGGAVSVSGNSRLIGGVVADRLTVTGQGLVRLLEPENLKTEVSLTSPPSGAAFIAPAAVSLQATAVDRDGSIARVEFFGNGTMLGTATTAPYQLALTQLAAGSHTFVARAWDNRGASQDSAPAVVSVIGNRPPAVAITSPVDGAVFIAPATFPVTAAATDPDGSIARVEFWRDDSKIADNFFAPFESGVRGLPAGTFILRARAFDNLGQASDSPPVRVVVAAPNRPLEVALTAPPRGSNLRLGPGHVRNPDKRGVPTI